MRMVFGLVLIAGVALAGFAVYKAKGYVGQYESALAHERERASRVETVETQQVFVISKMVRYGQRITSEDVRAVQFPTDAIPEGSFSELTDMFPENGPAFRTVTRTMESDEAILASKVTAPGKDAGITSRLEPGYRAFSIRVDATSGVSGLLRPGDNVDVYWTGHALEQEITKLILPTMRLIAIDQSSDEDLSEAVLARTVTVQATPQQVAALAQAQSSGRLSLSLVGVEDSTVAEVADVNQNSLLGIEVQQAVEVEVEEVCTQRVRRGTEILEMVIPCSQ